MLFAEYKRKIFWSVLLNVFFIYSYKYTETHLFFPVTALTPGLIDQILIFNHNWTIIYLSLFIFLGFGSFSLSTLKDFNHYLYLFAGVYSTALFIFFFFPTQISRPNSEVNNFLYNELIKNDLPYNAFPSLHASFCIITCFVFFRNSKSLYFKNIYRTFIVIWAALILFSILKIKQHYLIDIVGGIVNAIIWIWIIYFCFRKENRV